MNVIEKIAEQVELISEKKNYWVIRTDGGRLYENFKKCGVVGIGYSKITTKDLLFEKSTEKAYKEKLQKKIEKLYSEHERPGLVVSQLFRFANDIKAGDVVIIPGESSWVLAFGEVVDNKIYDSTMDEIQNTELRNDPDFQKFRKVSWSRTVFRDKLNPNLFQLLNSHQTIFSGNSYHEFIDGHMYDFYKKGNKYHLILKVGVESGINFRELFRTCLDLLDNSDEMAEWIGINEDSSKIETKVNLNSPGDVELISYMPYILILIGMFIVFVDGGKIEVNWGTFNFHIGTESFIDKMKSYLNAREDRKLKKTLDNKIKDLKIESPEEIVKLLESLNKKNQNENK